MAKKISKNKLKSKELNELKKKLNEIDKKFNSIKLNENLKKQKKDFLKLKKKVENLKKPTIRNLKTFEKTLTKIKNSFDRLHNPIVEKKQKNKRKKIIIFYLIFSFTLLSWVFFALNKFFPSIGDIFAKFLGSELSLIVSWGAIYILIGVTLIELIVGARIIEYNEIKFPWVFATMVVMFCFFAISTIYAQISIGQEDLYLVLRDSSDTTKIIGDIDCSGGSKSFLIVGETIVCNVNPPLNEEKIFITFTFKNKTKSERIELINNSFIAPEDIVYLLFEVNGLKEDSYFSANVGYPYEFLTEEGALAKKKEFLKYLGAIFAIIFVTIPIMMSKFKKLSKQQ